MAAPALDNADEPLEERDLHSIFRLWDEQHSIAGFDPVAILTRLSEIFEEETDIYMRKDPDPFDERHPSRTDPECELGRSLKLLFRKDHFMTRLVNDYLRDNFFTRQNIQKSSFELNVAACRLILVIMPGLETSAVFQSEFDNLIHRLYVWAESAIEPLQSYATGLLAAAMEVQDIAVGFREQNVRLVPLMLIKLHNLQTYSKQLKLGDKESNETVFDGNVDIALDQPTVPERPESPDKSTKETTSVRPFAHLGGGSAPNSPDPTISPQMNGMSKFKNASNLSILFQNDASHSHDIRYVRHSIQIHPATTETSQMLILRYLTSMGEYQEFLGQVFEHNAMHLIFTYIEHLDQKDTCLAFEALKYLASLLCHKKFSLEFIAQGGLERLMKVPRPSVSATGVSIALYYLAYCEDAMERICTMPKKFVSEVVNYALWLLGSPHDSGRCHATMFFGLAFQFKVILDEFDAQDGLRQLHNVISVLTILSVDDHPTLNDDEECAARQLVRHVCVALKKYMESHLYYKWSYVCRLHNLTSSAVPFSFRASKSTPEMISEQVQTLQEFLPFRARWSPVDQILSLGGITLLLRIIAYSYEWNYSGRAETVRSALDVLTICCVIPSVHLVFCERMELPDEASAAGINIILGAAEGEIVADAEVQKSALAVLVHCICYPLQKNVSRFGSTKKKVPSKNCEEVIMKLWESVRSNNGIIVLLQLMQIKTPITDADCIRGMACRALAGLARSETVRQIISKLQLFANSQLQSLMRDPILQEKRTEHVQFQKYAYELMERVSGKEKTGHQLDASLANIHKANVVAQTRIQFNEQQLDELIHEHLMGRGLTDTAATLQREANLIVHTPQLKSNIHHSPFSFRTPSSNMIRSRIRTKPSDFTAALNAIEASPVSNGTTTGPSVQMEDELINLTPSILPIKLIKKNHPIVTGGNNGSGTGSHTTQQRSLQKQISSETYIARPSIPSIESKNYSKKITLDTIITEYLTNQHALCKNPVSTCPQFDLFLPHKCPDPRPNKMSGLCTNFAGRFFRRQAGFQSRRFDRRLVHSHFCMSRTLRAQENEYYFTCADFTADAGGVMVGTDNGEVKVFNINDSSEDFAHHCHESFIKSVKCNRAGTLVLTSCSWRSPLCALWSINNKRFEIQKSWEDEEYLEFSNLKQDMILGTKAEVATIYDLHTGRKVSSFFPTIFNQYTKNRATFCPTDELILSDGVLWDVRSGKEIHKFDKLNQTLSGLFHPNGLEVVSNTEVWDLRTFHLLRTVPALDQCQVIFSPQNVIYGISVEIEPHIEFETGGTYESSFKTLDSYDFSSIATIDVKKYVYDLSVNKYGSQIAIVENQGGNESVQESAIRVYSVGRKRNTEDEMEEEDDDMEGSDSNSISDVESVATRGLLSVLRDLAGRVNNDEEPDEDVAGEAEGNEDANAAVFEMQSDSSDDDDDDDDFVINEENEDNDDNDDNENLDVDELNDNEDAMSWVTESEEDAFL